MGVLCAGPWPPARTSPGPLDERLLTHALEHGDALERRSSCRPAFRRKLLVRRHAAQDGHELVRAAPVGVGREPDHQGRRDKGLVLVQSRRRARVIISYKEERHLPPAQLDALGQGLVQKCDGVGAHQVRVVGLGIAHGGELGEEALGVRQRVGDGLVRRVEHLQRRDLVVLAFAVQRRANRREILP